MGFEATYADFSVDPTRLANSEVRLHGARFAGSHVALSAGGSVTLDFEVEDPEDVPQATLTVTALVSRLGSDLGYAPMDVLVQGEVVAEDLTVPGGGDLPHDNVFAVPGRLLKPGVNRLEIRSSAKSGSMLRLYRITLDPVRERGRSERARAAEAARDSVFTYRTEIRPAHAAFAPWQAAQRLLFHIDRDEHSLPAQLGWRGEGGAEAAISFQSTMSDFHGVYRTADGTAYEYRGRLTDRRPFSDDTVNLSASPLHHFHTEEGWGGDWHTSHELRLLVDDGGEPVERVTWRDQRGNSGTVVLHPDVSEVEVGGVEASDEFEGGGEVADNLLEDERGKWLAFADTAHLDLTLVRPAAVASYSLTSANDCAERDPRDWTLFGSHDGDTWTPLDTRSGEKFTERFQTRAFHLRSTSHAYRYYRLDITRNAGGAEIQLGRVRFAEAPAGQAFTGYYQRWNEGPIGYRGTPVAVPSAALPTARHIASELQAAVAGLSETARTLAALAEHLRKH
ncbi:alpha-1,2-mannosidase [Streptomyces heliomycini]|uniref:Alpha-1,2-mannosidase n=1 Tax=Streptomyces heliomycini TaxID=284032 RepID=A0ABV5L3Q2_9ACTN|nr:alpha-1,2-mannosidase [Streptomyces sp. XY152]KOV24400.1 alpha-1,2-mannosidase [Streptomyces sp. XY152]